MSGFTLPNTVVKQVTLRNLVEGAGTLLHNISKAPNLFNSAGDSTKQGIPNEEQQLLRAIGSIFASAVEILPNELESVVTPVARTMSSTERDYLLTDLHDNHREDDSQFSIHANRFRAKLLGGGKNALSRINDTIQAS